MTPTSDASASNAYMTSVIAGDRDTTRTPVSCGLVQTARKSAVRNMKILAVIKYDVVVCDMRSIPDGDPFGLLEQSLYLILGLVLQVFFCILDLLIYGIVE